MSDIHFCASYSACVGCRQVGTVLPHLPSIGRRCTFGHVVRGYVSERTGHEHALRFREWSARHFQGLPLQKLRHNSEAKAFFDAMKAPCLTNELMLTAKEALMNMVERGRFAPEDKKNPNVATQSTVAIQAGEWAQTLWVAVGRNQSEHRTPNVQHRTSHGGRHAVLCLVGCYVTRIRGSLLRRRELG